MVWLMAMEIGLRKKKKEFKALKESKVQHHLEPDSCWTVALDPKGFRLEAMKYHTHLPKILAATKILV